MDNVGPDNQLFEGLLEAIHQSPIATIVTDNRQADNPIVDANDAFIRLTGYARCEIVGRNCRFLAGPGTEPEARAAVQSTVGNTGGSAGARGGSQGEDIAQRGRLISFLSSVR